MLSDFFASLLGLFGSSAFLLFFSSFRLLPVFACRLLLVLAAARYSALCISSSWSVKRGTVFRCVMTKIKICDQPGSSKEVASLSHVISPD